MSKQMTSKWFLSLAIRSTKSAEGFLEGYKEWLCNGELADKAAPIVARIDSGETKPAIGLEAIKNIALQHSLTKEIEKAERNADSSGRGSDKPYSAVILSVNGEPVLNNKGEPLKANFDLLQQSERWAQRRLVESETDCYAEITWNNVFKDGVPRVSKVTRTEAIYEQRKVTRHPFMHVNKSNGGKAKMKVSPKHYQFSRG